MTPENLLILARIRAGMDVCDSEHHPIGRAGKVYRNADYGTPPTPAAPKIVEPYLEVQRGDRPLYVPTSYVSDVEAECIVLNVLPDRVDSMGWDSRPDFIQDLDPRNMERPGADA